MIFSAHRATFSSVSKKTQQALRRRRQKTDRAVDRRASQNISTAKKIPVYCAKCNAPVHGKKITPLAEIERQTIFGALKAHGGDRIEAAASLGIGISTIYKKLKEYEEA